jgi:hypothetical protein
MSARIALLYAVVQNILIFFLLALATMHTMSERPVVKKPRPDPVRPTRPRIFKPAPDVEGVVAATQPTVSPEIGWG